MRRGTKWIVAGAVIGLLIPVGIRVYDLQLGLVPPVIVCLFWPPGFMAGFLYPTASLGLPAILVNALLFGAIAAILRSRFVLLLAVLATIAWWLLPPSDGFLARGFSLHRDMLQALTEMSKRESDIVRITANEVGTADGKTYGMGKSSAILADERWSEYRQQLGALHMTELAIGRGNSGEVFVFAKTPQLGVIGSSYGYLYCPEKWDRAIYFLPCSRGDDWGDSGACRYRRLDLNWYIYKVFEPYPIE